MDNLKFYLVNVGGYIDVIDYATYETIKLLDINIEEGKAEAKKFLTKLSKLNNSAYINMLLDLTKNKNTDKLYKARDKEREGWIEGAWLQVTEKTLKELNLNINYHYNRCFEKACNEYNIISSKNTFSQKTHLNINNKEEDKNTQESITPKQIENTTTKREERKRPKLKRKLKRKIKTI